MAKPHGLESAPRAGPVARPTPRGGLSSPAKPDLPEKPLAGRLPGPALRIRLAGAAVLAVLVLAVWFGAPWAGRLQAAWFDAHQALVPRVPQSLPVTIVAVDQASLRELGQWPWPRSLLARLVDKLARAEPAAIGVGILMPEPDALSPERLLTQAQVWDHRVAEALRTLPSNDALLARALAGAPVALALAGTLEPGSSALRVAPVLVSGAPGAPGDKSSPQPALPRYAGALGNLDEIDRSAGGWGLVSVESSRGMIRRVPLVADVGGTLVPTLALEMLRLAQQVPAHRLAVSGDDVLGVSVGRLSVPTDADGGLRVYFAPHDAQRFVSAVEVLRERVDPGRFRDRLVLIGLTGIGLQEALNTPIGERQSAPEIHAQLLENLVEGSWLRRPAWAGAFEASVLAGLGALLIWLTPRRKPFEAALLLVGCVVLAVALAFAAFRWQRLLFDAALPSLALLVLFVVLLLLTLAEATRQGRLLRQQVQAQRERSARIAGELQAAQSVQTAALPSTALLAGDPRIELHAALQPAREVGGDLYDFYRLDDRRLFVLVGDVAGKGLSASIFMAVSKALYKSAMLRAPAADLGAVMRLANAEVSRDNAQALFVTVFAAIVDLDSGWLDYCNAGHDNPYRLHPSYPAPLRIADGDGPPLCAAPDYPYRGARCRLLPGETLCLMTDGVTDARDPAGEMYGAGRVLRQFGAWRTRGGGARDLVEALRADVLAFDAGAEPADDLTILALRWNGPPAGAAA